MSTARANRTPARKRTARGRGLRPAHLQSLADRVDALYAAKEARRAAERELRAGQLTEAEEEQAILGAARDAGLTVVHGRVAVAEVRDAPRITVTDWPRLFAFVKARDAWDLIQKRLTESAARTRMDRGEEVPGTESKPGWRLGLRARTAADVR